MAITLRKRFQNAYAAFKRTGTRPQNIIDNRREFIGPLEINSNVGIFGLIGEDRGKEVYKQVSLKDLQNEDLRTLIPKVVKSDPAIDQVTAFFQTLTTKNHKVTAETDAGQRLVDGLLEMLRLQKNPLSLAVNHCASSLILWGDICIETEFDENRNPKNLWVIEPHKVEWRLLPENNSTRWAMGTYRDGNWVEIDSPNVEYIAGAPMVGERSSRSPIQAGLFPALSQSAMLANLESIIAVQAWSQTIYSIQKLEMLKLQAEGAEIDDINAEIKSAKEQLSKLKDKMPSQILALTDDIKAIGLQGGGVDMLWTKEMGTYQDKRVSQGTKTPTTVGGPQERADYSTKQQGLFYSALLENGQENIQYAIEWAFTRFLRAMGSSDTVHLTSKSSDVVSRQIEAETFLDMMLAVKAAVDAGMTLPTAIQAYEEESGQTFSDELKNRILKDARLDLSQDTRRVLDAIRIFKEAEAK